MSLGTAAPQTTERKNNNVNTIQALVQLLRTRSYDEIRQRMYDNPPGTAWWNACKTELDIRNREQLAASALETSRVLEKMKASAEQLNSATDRFLQASQEMTGIVKDTKDAGRRMELATYVIIAVTILQLFYAIFNLFSHR